jgi:Universal stress protein UspA and related nucleotide-binding proteins
MRILVAFDNSPSGRRSLQFATKFKDVCDKLIVLYVNPDMVKVASSVDNIVPEAVFSDQEKFIEEIGKSIEELVENTGIKYEFLKIEAGGDEVASRIHEVAKEKQADFIVTGTRKLSGLSKFILGSVSSELIKISTLPVMVVSPEADSP